jgi:ATPase subunit of ABC transporter with duplicated ATPase domains
MMSHVPSHNTDRDREKIGLKPTIGQAVVAAAKAGAAAAAAVNTVIEVEAAAAQDDTPLALAASSTAGRNGGKAGRGKSLSARRAAKAAKKKAIADAGSAEAAAAQHAMTQAGQVDVDDLDDLSSAWVEAGKTGRKWGGAGFGGRGWLQNGQVENARDIILYNVTLSYAGKLLIGQRANDGLAGISLKLMRGHRYGLMGNNGCGKTTLLRRFASGSMPGFPRHLTTLLVDQELGGGALTAAEEVLAADTKAADLQQQQEELERLMDDDADDDLTEEEREAAVEQLGEVLEKLELCEAGGLARQRVRAEETLVELGFTSELLKRPTAELSGGWKMRVALAKAAFMKPDVWMLDEPTNHLDLRAVGWLERQLKQLGGQEDTIVLIVSHDRAFLSEVATDILEFANQTIKQWGMPFDDYIEAKRARAAKQGREVENLEKRRTAAIEAANKMEKVANSKKGDQKKSKQVAQMRKKATSMGFNQDADGQKLGKFSTSGARAGSLLDAHGSQTNQMGQGGGRLNLATCAAAMFSGGGGDAPFRVRFHAPPALGNPRVAVLQLSEVAFRWPGAAADLLVDVTLSAHIGQRIALVGANGQGKSTLVELMRGAIQPTRGEVVVQRGATVAHYSQHAANSLPPEATPLEHLAQLFPHDTEAELRWALHSPAYKISHPFVMCSCRGRSLARARLDQFRARVVQHPWRPGGALQVRDALRRAEGAGRLRGSGARAATPDAARRAHESPGHDDHQLPLGGAGGLRGGRRSGLAQP